jgi:hypothetical protein
VPIDKDRNVSNDSLLTPYMTINGVVRSLGDIVTTYQNGPQSARPSNPSVGDQYFNTTINELQIYTINGWVSDSTPPKSPTNVSAVNSPVAYGGVPSAIVSFTPSTSGMPAGSYTVISSPGGLTATGTSSPITVAGLTAGTSYTFSVTANNSYGSATSAASSPLVSGTLSAAPTIGTATNSGAAGLTISFTAPSPNTGAATITSYLAVVSPGNYSATGTSSPITVPGLGSNGTYTAQVYAINSAGTSPASLASNSVAVTVTPNAPTAVSAVDVGISRPYNNAAATVTFTAPSGGVAPTSYIASAFQNGVASGAASSGASSPIVVPGLIAGTTYTFQVQGVAAAGVGSYSSPSNPITVTGTPAAPTIGVATLANNQLYSGTASVQVYFTPPSNNGGLPITSYKVTSSSGATTNGSSSPITISETQLGVSNTYTVQATNANGSGAVSFASNSLVSTTAPQAPTIGAATQVPGTPYGGTPSTSVTFTPPANNGGATITSYIVTSSSGASNTGTSSPIVVTEATIGSYTYSVKAYNAQGFSASSASTPSINLYTVPQAPTISSVTNVTGRPYGSPAVNVAITANGTGGTPIISYTALSSSASTNSGASSTQLISEASNGPFNYTAQVTNAVGTSLPSSSFTGPTMTTTPQAPTITSVTNVAGRPYGSPQAVISWTPGANNGGSPVTSYTISSSSGVAAVTGITSSPYTFQESAAGNYTYSVAAVNSLGTGTPGTFAQSVSTLPTAPSSLSAAVVNNTTINLTYGSFDTANSPQIPLVGSGTNTGDIIDTTGTAVTLTYSGTLSPSGGTITVTGIFNVNNSYNFTMVSRNSNGVSPTVSTTTAVVPNFSFVPFSFVPFSFVPFSFTPFSFTPFSFAPIFSFTPFSFAPIFSFTPFSFAPKFSFTPAVFSGPAFPTPDEEELPGDTDDESTELI